MIGYQQFWKPLLFRLDAERAHSVSAGMLKWIEETAPFLLGAIYGLPSPVDQSREVAGLRFTNPIGLAAGFDKNAELVDAMAFLGFGFVEVGTVTPKPQAGNPRPRLFRLPEDEAIINRMGFNNQGVNAAAKRLANRKNRDIVVGGNIGKNKETSNEDAWKDYVYCFRVLAPEVDYITLNMSSPNTVGLRQLLEREYLQTILEPVQNENQKRSKPRPVFLKISPDMASDSLAEVVETSLSLQVSGLIATNTTITRNGLETNMQKVHQAGAGGLSGKPLGTKSVEVLQTLLSLTQHRLPIMASGGIMNPADIKNRLSQGADLVQLYSGLVYYGPGLVRDGLRRLASDS